MNNTLIIPCMLLLLSILAACAPEVGSDAWCEDMVETPKGDWSTNDATEFARSCVFKSYDDD